MGNVKRASSDILFRLLTFVLFVSTEKRNSSRYSNISNFSSAAVTENVAMANVRYVSAMDGRTTMLRLRFVVVARLVGIKMLGRGTPPNSPGASKWLAWTIPCEFWHMAWHAECEVRPFSNLSSSPGSLLVHAYVSFITLVI